MSLSTGARSRFPISPDAVQDCPARPSGEGRTPTLPNIIADRAFRDLGFGLWRHVVVSFPLELIVLGLGAWLYPPGSRARAMTCRTLSARRGASAEVRPAGDTGGRTGSGNGLGGEQVERFGQA